MATPPRPGMPLGSRRVDLWPGWGGHGWMGVRRGQLMLEDCKTTSPTVCHLPSPYSHLGNRHIERVALCTLLAASYPVYTGAKFGAADRYMSLKLSLRSASDSEMKQLTEAASRSKMSLIFMVK